LEVVLGTLRVVVVLFGPAHVEASPREDARGVVFFPFLNHPPLLFRGGGLCFCFFVSTDFIVCCVFWCRGWGGTAPFVCVGGGWPTQQVLWFWFS